MMEAFLENQLQAKNVGKKKILDDRMKTITKVVFVCFAISFAAVIVMAGIMMLRSLQSQAEEVTSKPQGLKTLGAAFHPLLDTGKSLKSCLAWRRHGYYLSGVYNITDFWRTEVKHETYCDMTTDGGGWTLVASINNKTINCRYYDFWVNSVDGHVRHWATDSTNGDVRYLTSSDYKSPLYSTLEASDVLVAQIPKHSSLFSLEDGTMIKYYTTNHFLSQSGKTLQNFYFSYAALQQLSILGIDKVVIRVLKRSFSLADYIPHRKQYSYNRLNQSLIFQSKNVSVNVLHKVYFSVNDEPYTELIYGQKFTDNVTYHVSSSDMHPLFLIASINNCNSYPSSFKIKVVSKNYGRPFRVTQSLEGWKTYKGVTYSYYVKRMFAGRSDPSWASVFFHFKGNAIWSESSISVLPPKISGVSSGNITYEFETNREVSNGILGYFLLSVQKRQTLSRESVDNILEFMIDILVSSEGDIRKLTKRKELFVPVTFAKGSISYPNHNVSSGFLQFRAYDKFGSPFALCPGVKLGPEADPAHFCLGSVYSKNNHAQRCGNMAAWSNVKEHVVQNRFPIPEGRFVNDVSSTFLIFTRNHFEVPTLP